MCCDGYAARPEDTVGQCEVCGGDVDADGDTTEAGCNYSSRCNRCGYSPCDEAC